MLNVDMIRRTIGRASEGRWRWLERSHRSIEVTVVLGGREVDSFLVADPALLRPALEPVLKHLPVGEGHLRLTAVEERRLPFGLLSRRKEATLGNPLQALAFLDARAERAA